MKTDLYKLGDILNSEGTIIGAFTDENQQIYIGLLTQNHPDLKMIFIETKFSEFKNYLQSKMSLKDLSKDSARGFFAKHSNNSIERIKQSECYEVVSNSQYSGFIKDYNF